MARAQLYRYVVAALALVSSVVAVLYIHQVYRDSQEAAEVEKLLIATLRGDTDRGLFHSVRFSPDGKKLASVCSDARIWVWDMTSMSEVIQLEGVASDAPLDYSPDGRLLASTSMTQIKVWDTTTWEMRPVGEDWQHCLTFAPNSRTLATGKDRIILLGIDIGESRVIGKISYSKGVYDLAFSPDGQTLVEGGGDGLVRIWDVATGAQRASFAAHKTPGAEAVHCVAFIPGTNMFATAGAGETMKLWDERTGESRGTLKAFGKWIKSISMSPDGKMVAVALGVDFKGPSELKLLDLDCAEELFSLTTPNVCIRAVCFSPDGTMLATAEGMHPMVRIWDVARLLEKGQQNRP